MKKAVLIGGIVTTLACLVWVQRAASLPQAAPSNPAPSNPAPTNPAPTNPAPSQTPPASAAASFKPVSELEHLMEGQELHFKAIDELLKDTAVKDRLKKLAMHADVLAELANVNTFNKDKTDYKTWAGQVRDLSLKLAAEADKKAGASEEELKSLRKQISDTCAACHDAYD
ncbi:MAG: hypothetical protein IT449_11245 [Phycisphaerales bacterium]|nr:hypothetical protein [Phycisphaerales bacterium]